MRAAQPLTGLGWMVLAQLCFAAMNVFTRLGSRHLPWPEIAAARFLVGALIAVGLAAARGKSLAVTDRGGTWRRSIYGTIAALGSFFALASPRVASSVDEGLDKVERSLAEVAARGATIVCFPEAYLPGLRGLDFDVPAFDRAD